MVRADLEFFNLPVSASQGTEIPGLFCQGQLKVASKFVSRSIDTLSPQVLGVRKVDF